jgi:hypothetical protein
MLGWHHKQSSTSSKEPASSSWAPMTWAPLAAPLSCKQWTVHVGEVLENHVTPLEQQNPQHLSQSAFSTITEYHTLGNLWSKVIYLANGSGAGKSSDTVWHLVRASCCVIPWHQSKRATHTCRRGSTRGGLAFWAALTVTSPLPQ